ncbi:MAG: DUF2007 domain-containing protein [Clostridia bacterium]|nr:DUF2007 domain-containing protein [Clostridia bacterium]
MKECHVCFALCDDDAVLCPVCGAELKNNVTDAENEAAAQEENIKENLINNPVLAASADSPVTAEIYKDILDENGIAYSVDEKGDFFHTGFGGGFFAIDVYVDEKNIDMAKELYRNLSESEFSLEDFEELNSDDTEKE